MKIKPQTVRVLYRSSCIGLFSALVGIAFLCWPLLDRGSLLPDFYILEESVEERIGLPRLFRAREVWESIFGASYRPADEVVIISMSQADTDYFGFDSDQPWPRSIQACLIHVLSEAGVALTVMDVTFHDANKRVETRPADDSLMVDVPRKALAKCPDKYHRGDGTDNLATSIESAGNVALVHDLRIYDEPEVYVEALKPRDDIADAAHGLAVNMLPTGPGFVHRFWTFFAPFSGHDDVFPGLPLVALHAYANPEMQRFSNALRAKDINLDFAVEAQPADVRTSKVLRLREEFLRTPGLMEGLLNVLEPDAPAEGSERPPDLLRNLVRAYAGSSHPYLNFYGYPNTVKIVPFRVALLGAADLRNKVVFVGSTDYANADAEDGWPTAMTNRKSVRLSGVEILATAFSNLLRNETLRLLDLGGLLALMLGFGVISGLIAGMLEPVRALFALTLFGCAYAVLSLQLFSNHSIWLPVFLPLLLQLPAAVLAGAVVHYDLARRISKRLGMGDEPPERGTERVRGTCLATDAENYTATIERLERENPAYLETLMNDYYNDIATVIYGHDGRTTDYSGDGSMSFWNAGAHQDGAARLACHAALALQRAVAAFNGRHGSAPLPTRVGLDSGEFEVGFVGNPDHLQHKVVGDTPNTAARIEGLNKLLGTRVLASAKTTRGLSELLLRPCGLFRLVGKEEPVEIIEIMGLNGELPQSVVTLCEKFRAAAQLYRDHRWSAAHAAFKQLATTYGDDGPTQFYLPCSKKYMESPPTRADAHVHVVLTK